VTINRILGLENEYGISSSKNTDPITLSNRLVSAYAKHIFPNIKIRWDYDVENPLRDARGFDFTRAEVDYSVLTHEDMSVYNFILPNGGRFYVDHAHPEYSSPETINPLDVVKWDLAGEAIMQKAASLDLEENPEDPIRIFKNNVDNKGSSYGTHENYSTLRQTPFGTIVKHLTAHLISRQIYCGAGRIGIGQNSEIFAYQISQRADYIENHVGLETTLRRPIINTRDEPHADPTKYRRLHLILGDANMSDMATLLKVGTTSIILSMIEDGFLDDLDLEIAEPVNSTQLISHDLTMQKTIEMKNGKNLTAINIQEMYLKKAKSWLENNEMSNEYRLVMDNWESTLIDLKIDMFTLASKIDWIAKYQIIQKYAVEKQLDYKSSILQSIDIKYSEITKNDGIAQLLRKSNILMQLFESENIENAILNPPKSTRAWLRGKALAKYSDNISAASWDSLIFDVDKTESLIRMSTLDPYWGDYESVNTILEKSHTASDFISNINSLSLEN